MRNRNGDSDLPTRMTVGGRTYEILSFEKCRPRYDSLGYSNSMSQRTRKWKAHLGQEEGEHFLKYKAEIPPKLRKSKFIFTAWRRSFSSEDVACIEWRDKEGWISYWVRKDDWDYTYRVLRRTA